METVSGSVEKTGQFTKIIIFAGCAEIGPRSKEYEEVVPTASAVAPITPGGRPSSVTRDDQTRTRVKDRDFKNTGYDKGHMASNAPIATRYGCEAQFETFLLTNITPQLPDLNQRTRASLEGVTDDLYANDFDGVWIMTGPVFDPENVVTLCGTEIEVPVEFWKIVVRKTETNGIDAMAIIMPQKERSSKAIEKFVTTIDDVEERTGIDFFTSLSTSEESSLESRCPGDEWHLTQRLVPPNEDWGAPRKICKEDAIPRARPLNTIAGGPPMCSP